MEDISSLIWLGIIIVWFLTRILRRGARKASRDQKRAARPPAPAAQGPTTRSGAQPRLTGRDGQGPPPIVPH